MTRARALAIAKVIRLIGLEAAGLRVVRDTESLDRATINAMLTDAAKSLEMEALALETAMCE